MDSFNNTFTFKIPALFCLQEYFKPSCIVDTGDLSSATSYLPHFHVTWTTWIHEFNFLTWNDP